MNKVTELADVSAAFLQWRVKGWQPAFYAHLFSQSRFAALAAFLHERLLAEDIRFA